MDNLDNLPRITARLDYVFSDLYDGYCAYRTKPKTTYRLNNRVYTAWQFYGILCWSIGFLALLCCGCSDVPRYFSLNRTTSPSVVITLLFDALGTLAMLGLGFFSYFDVFGHALMWISLRGMRQAFPIGTEVVFENSAILIRKPLASSEVDWHYYRDFKESKNVFLLFDGQRRYWVIPKRVFSSEPEILAFRDLLQLKMGQST